MEQIVLRYPNGQVYPIQRMYPLTTITKAEQIKELLGKDEITVTVECTEKLEPVLGTIINFAGEDYTLNVIPRAEKLSNNNFSYDFKFEAAFYDLIRAVFLDVDASGVYRGAEFDLIGDLNLFVGVLLNSANNHYGAGKWIMGEVGPTETKTMSFSNINCLQALNQICAEFKVEFLVETMPFGVRRLHVKTIGELKGFTFKYGYQKGAKRITRTSVNDSRIVNRIYPYGSTENLPYGYRNHSPRLRIGDAGADFIDDNESIEKFGLHAISKDFDDVKPHRIGTVTGSSTESPFEFFDTYMDFNLSEKIGETTTYIPAGKSPKITFQTGGLAGKQYEMSAYDHTIKKFTLVPVKDQNGLETPGIAPFVITVGDEYILTDIYMPNTYVVAAEGELATKATNFMDANKYPLVRYSLELDDVYLREFTGNDDNVVTLFLPGDLVTMQDTDLSIDKSIRITRLTRNVLAPYEYTIDLADSYDISYVNRTVLEQREIKTIIRMNDLRDPIRARMNWRTQQELLNLVFDTEGQYYSEKIKPLSIETTMLSVGAKSQQLILNVVIEPNFNGQKNTVRVNAGTLTHYVIEPTIKTWNISSQTTSLGNDLAYYIYAKCSKTSNLATILFSQVQIKVDDDGSYYHFLLGVLHSVDPMLFIRWINLTYGATSINGRFIKTGVIMSANGDCYFDLDNGEIGGKITFRLANGSKKLVADIYQEQKDFAALVTQQLGENDGLVETWFFAGVPTLSNQPAVNWNTIPLKDDHLNDLYYNNLTNKSYRFTKTNGVYGWIEITDTDITDALAIANLALDTADGKRRVFVAQPFPPYDVGDLWANGVDLKMCIVQRLSGSFNAADWDEATTYDNTTTVINGGIVTSGRIQLAGEGGSVLAGISGEGTLDTSVRFWAGASYANRAIAPFRVTQNGNTFVRMRLELMNSSNVGQAGICGANSPGDGEVRIWAGSDYAGRNTAVFRVLANGNMIASAGQIGNWTISSGGLVNNEGTAYIIMRSSLATKQTSVVLGTNVFPATYGGKGAMMVSALEDNTIGSNFAIVSKAANAGPGFENFAFYGEEGIVFTHQTLFNGKKSLVYPITASTPGNSQIDPSQYDIIILQPSVSNKGISFGTTFKFPMRDGKQILVFNENGGIDTHLFNIIRNSTDTLVPGGHAYSLFWINGYWYLSGSITTEF